MITLSNALTFTTGGMLGVLLGYFIEHQLARSRSIEAIRIVEFNKAAAAFYSSFLDEIIFLEDTDPKEVSIELLKRADISKRREQESIDMRHRKAMIMFRPYIDESNLAGFDAAWSKYHEWTLYYGDEKQRKRV